LTFTVYTRGHQRGARGHQVTRKDDVGRLRACSKNNISMINVFTLTNINTRVIESKMSKTFSCEVCIKLVAFALIGTQEVARSFQKVGDPWSTQMRNADTHDLPL